MTGPRARDATFADLPRVDAIEVHARRSLLRLKCAIGREKAGEPRLGTLNEASVCCPAVNVRARPSLYRPLDIVAYASMAVSVQAGVLACAGPLAQLVRAQS
jgi:hypothetical protein